MGLIDNPVFWVAVAFLIFIGVIFWKKVPAKIVEALDRRAAKITHELNEARSLKEEAKALLAQIQRKHKDAEDAAESILQQSKEEAKLFAREAEKDLAEYFRRQEKALEERIAQAELDAVKNVQSAAVEAAISAAVRILSNGQTEEARRQITDKAISELGDDLGRSG